MKRINAFFILLPLLTLNSCNTLHKLLPARAGQTSGPAAPPPDIYTISGTTYRDFQTVDHVRVLDSSISIQVKTLDTAEFRTLNEYEFGFTDKGTGGGAIWFKRHVDVGEGGILYISSECAAPKGSAYNIQSIRTGAQSIDFY